MNPALLKSLLAFVPVFLLLIGSAVLYRKRKSAGRFLQLLGAASLLLVGLTHLFEATHLFPGMHWGEAHSPGHYLDLGSAIAGLVLFPVGFMWDALTQDRT